MRILHAIEEHEQVRSTGDVRQAPILLRRAQRHHALMSGRPRQPIESGARLEPQGDRALPGQIDDLLEPRSAGAFRHQDPFEGPAGAQRFGHGVNARQNHASGFNPRPLLNQFVKLAIATISVISTICSELKCSAKASRVSRASAVRVSSRAYWMAARSGKLKGGSCSVRSAANSSSVTPAFLLDAV